MDKTIALKPRMSEKSYALSQLTNTYVFDVPSSVNKMQIEKAVEKQFDVQVKTVRISILKGKEARSIRIGARTRSNVAGKRNNVKKAYVTLVEGNSIPVFAALDEQQEKLEKAEAKMAKAEAKTQSKEKTEKDAKDKKSILSRRKTKEGG
jgi:large subunit ribosomal protein L23